jgi:hypothetical protein
MDGNENQQQLLSNSSEQINNVTIIDETPLTDDQPEQIEGIPTVIPKVFQWNTSMISEVRIYDSLVFEC